MKFGKYLEDRKSHLPGDYASNCIDYTALKQLLKDTVYASSIKLDPSLEQQQSFAEVVSQRLGQLQICEVDFIKQLDIQVAKISDFFQKESGRLVAETTKDQSTPTDLLQKILTLERFVFLNYTGITKILKKNDRHSGLALSEPYLHRVAQLPLVKAEDLTQLKQTVMNKLQQQLHTTGSEQQQQQHDGATAMMIHSSGSPPMIRSRSHYKFTSNAALPPTFVGPNQKVLVSLSGPHGTDIVGAVLECLARHPCAIEDFMLSRLYHNVTFGVLITLQSDNVAVFRDLAEAAQQWDATLTFDVPDTQATEPSIRNRGDKKIKTQPTQSDDEDQIYLPASLEEAPYSGRIKYAASILNQNGLQASFLSQCTQLLLKHHISVEKLSRLDKRHTLSCADLRLSVPTAVDMDHLRKELIDLAASFGSDVALQPDDVFRKNKRLVVFDMDSTLIQQEVIDEIARYAGVVDQVAVST